MIFLNESRTGIVAPNVNIPLESTTAFEGAWNTVGAAHSINRNLFLFAYVFSGTGSSVHADIHAKRVTGSPTTDVKDVSPEIPVSFKTARNYPNPFNPATSIVFNLPENGHVRISVYNLSGRLVRELVNEPRSAGPQQIKWNGQDDRGQDVASGIYTYKIEFGEQVIVKKMTLLR